MIIQNEIQIECKTCGCTMDYDYDEIKINSGIKQIVKVTVCDRCIRDTFDEAFKIMSDKAGNQDNAEDTEKGVHYQYDDAEDYDIHSDDEIGDEPMC